MLKWQAYISGALLTVIVTVSAYGQLTRAEHWTLKAAKHKPKTLTSERLKRTADLANIEKFKQELKPFMKVRVSGTTANVEVQEHIKSRMNSLGWYVEEDRFDATTPFEDKNFNNIIATYNPKARRKLTLACHFDSKYFAKGNFIGATDSAVPCAMLIHLADVLSNLLKKGSGDGAKDLSLQLIFFDGEEAFVRWTNEDSIYGARHLAEKLKNTPFPPDNTENTNELHRMDVLVLLDLIGAANPKFYSWFDNTRGLFDRLRKIETRLTKAELIPSHEAYFSDRPMFGNAGIEDDHIPFLRESVPVLHLICYPFPKVWHTVYDDESALDYQTISNLNKIMQVFVIEYLHLKS